MRERTRLAACIGGAALLIGAALWSLQWPLAGPDPPQRDASAARQRIEALRADIERELQRLQAAREQRDLTQAELRALDASLEASRARVERLRRELEAGGQGSP